MNILLSNHHLQKVGGTENYTYAMAVELLRRGHEVEYFTLHPGEISKRLESIGVRFMSRKSYDLVLANHRSTVRKLWRKGFIVQTCHGAIPSLEQPSIYAHAFVAVTSEVRDHLRSKGFDSIVIHNGIDCKRFAPEQGISTSLRKVLSLCQSDEANSTIGMCCQKMGVELVTANKHTDNRWDVERLINEADMVVGIGRSMYDAMACGRCVVSYDYRPYMKKGMGCGYINTANIEPCIYYNCSGRGCGGEMGENELTAALQAYDPADGERNREYALRHLNIEKVVETYLEYATRCKASSKGRIHNFFRRFLTRPM